MRMEENEDYANVIQSLEATPCVFGISSRRKLFGKKVFIDHNIGFVSVNE